MDPFRYQWMNHYALFARDYRQDAVEYMEKLIEKYGKKEKNEGEDDCSSTLS